jgi:hypothetical protein
MSDQDRAEVGSPMRLMWRGLNHKKNRNKEVPCPNSAPERLHSLANPLFWFERGAPSVAGFWRHSPQGVCHVRT